MDKREWVQHPVTQELIKELLGDLSNLKEAWGDGVYTTESIEGTVQQNAKALGKVEAVGDILSWIEEGGEDD